MKEAHAKVLAELETAHSRELHEYDVKALTEVSISSVRVCVTVQHAHYPAT